MDSRSGERRREERKGRREGKKEEEEEEAGIEGRNEHVKAGAAGVEALRMNGLEGGRFRKWERIKIRRDRSQKNL